MKCLILIALASGCLTDPPYRPYAQQQGSQTGYGPPPAQQPHGPYADPNSPTGYSNHPTYQTNLNPAPAPTGPQPPPFDPSSQAQGGVTVIQSPPPQQAPQPAPLPAPPAPASPPQAQPPATPPSSGLPPTVAGRYVCWVSGAGMYAQSSLGTITLDFNSSYSSTANATAPGTYRVDGNHVLFTAGPLASYVGVLESNRNGPLLRFRVEHPNDPGPQLNIGDHVCYLAH